MKKILLLVALATMMAAPAMANSISGSLHDLSTRGTPGVTEVCAFCHTPHAARTVAPLWNRNDPATALTHYTSSTMNATSGANPSDATLCLSCHDNASLTSLTLVNSPGTSTYTPATITALTSTANIGLDLRNDHPVGFAYADAGTVTAGDLKTAPTGAVKLYSMSGPGTDVWCSSCHNVHDNAVVPFLRVSNANSALCMTCHDK